MRIFLLGLEWVTGEYVRRRWPKDEPEPDRVETHRYASFAHVLRDYIADCESGVYTADVWNGLN